MQAEIQDTITKESLIGTIVEEHPEVVETLLSFGVHCVGCHVSPFEPLGEGLAGHGMTDVQVDEVVVKLNKVVEEHKKEKAKITENQHKPISMTDLAAEKIKKVCEEKGKQALRVAVKPGGCSGYEYVFDLAETADTEDLSIEYKGAIMVIDPASLEKLQGSVIDYNDGLTGAGFIVTNPTAASTCGCGTSFN